jgi:hypothetical protein
MNRQYPIGSLFNILFRIWAAWTAYSSYVHFSHHQIGYGIIDLAGIYAFVNINFVGILDYSMEERMRIAAAKPPIPQIISGATAPLLFAIGVVVHIVENTL